MITGSGRPRPADGCRSAAQWDSSRTSRARRSSARTSSVVAAAATQPCGHASRRGGAHNSPAGNRRIDPVQQGGVPPASGCRPGLPLLTTDRQAPLWVGPDSMLVRPVWPKAPAPSWPNGPKLRSPACPVPQRIGAGPVATSGRSRRHSRVAARSVSGASPAHRRVRHRGKGSRRTGTIHRPSTPCSTTAPREEALAVGERDDLLHGPADGGLHNRRDRDGKWLAGHVAGRHRSDVGRGDP